MLSAVLLLGGITLFAQDEPDRVWTLHECMVYAMEHSPEYAIQQATNDSRRVDHREAYLGYIPSINASASVTANFGRMIDPETNVYTNTTALSNSYGISASMDIFNGLSTLNSVRITKTARLMGIEEERLLKDDICLQIIQAYYNVLYHEGMVSLAQEQLDESLETLHQGKVKKELGLVVEADLLQIESQVAQRRYTLTRAENTLQESFITLKKVMFYPMNREIVLENVISPVGRAEVSFQDADSIVEAASEYLPELKAQELDIRIAELDLQTARWKLVPHIYAQGGYSTGYVYSDASQVNLPFWNQMNDKQGQYVGIGISIPIFSSLSKYNNIARRRNDLKIAQARYDIKKQEIEAEIRRAVQDMGGTLKEYNSAEAGVQAQESAHIANKKKYDEGLLSIIELQTSSNSLLEAKARRLNCALQYLLKERVVLYYKGISYIDQD